MIRRLFTASLCLSTLLAPALLTNAAQAEDPTAMALEEIAQMQVGKLDWPQWAGWSHKNNTPSAKDLPTEWDVGSGENILWSAALGSQSYGNPVIGNGKVYVGSNNHHAYLSRFPKTVDMGVLLCFDEKTGKFLWQHSNQKLPTGRVHDWPDQGICSSVFIDGERVWYVSSRGEVVCLDAEGFHDGENDGPFRAEDNENRDEADVLWKYDMMGMLGVSQHNMCNCSLTCVGDVLFVNTSNGVDESHTNIPAPNAASFFAINRDTGKVLWSDKSPGLNILHGQWSSPAYAVIGGQPQVLFGGGDGWLYSFDPQGDGAGQSKLLWKFDCNPKESKYSVSGRSERNHLIGTPVIYDGLVFIGVGEDPEHGEGNGHLWCIDPTKRGDVSPTLAVDANNKPVVDKNDGTRRLQAINPAVGEKAIPNPNSAVVWHYVGDDTNGNGEVDFEEEMHRTCGTVAIKDDLLFIADFSGIFHCLDAKTGKSKWNYDMFAAAWGSPMIADGKVYIGDEDGDIAIFKLSPKSEQVAEVSCANSVYSTPVVANNILYIANKSTLFAIGAKKDEAEASK
ncbi:outer membrane protein assembly factor BamB family protein [Planctomicrobium piriforme]|uniref:Outer membrane protein assembly factor BamB, contains PQQ-like beta-propeller repeat n=1 Tax=Planctomicrobium piriforme TaxID=1576369 RepID=A0A1I3FG20_9PLAN|nr:PQQ-binding-like beta-propeller repeat protein [Planctomicrobium piriforme]SFI10140.1 Outer membrane protein assembly factor BamB, contains PQQ-like beta-propeller repeat [Planctomicrobium piriforme]